MLIQLRYSQNPKILITQGILNSLQSHLAFHINKVAFDRAMRAWMMSVGPAML